jgi:hypothetical protein
VPAAFFQLNARGRGKLPLAPSLWQNKNLRYTIVMKIQDIEQHKLNAKKSLAVAVLLFPDEKWINTEKNIYVAKNRMIEKVREREKWEREMSQVRILANRGNVIYFLPEKKNEGKGKVYVDTVIDGEIVELKTVSGNRNTLGTAFEQGFKQGAALVREYPQLQTHSVFIRLFSNLTIGSVKAKIAGELKNRPKNGFFICYFEQIKELYSWSYEELRMLIKKLPGSTTAEPGSAGWDSGAR